MGMAKTYDAECEKHSQFTVLRWPPMVALLETGVAGRAGEAMKKLHFDRFAACLLSACLSYAYVKGNFSGGTLHVMW
jgi:hypothetical protein